MSLDKKFLDLENPKQKSPFGIISTGLASTWILLIYFTRSRYYFVNNDVLLYILMSIQSLGLITAFISIKRNETRRILYLIGFIINGIGLLYILIAKLF